MKKLKLDILILSLLTGFCFINEKHEIKAKAASFDSYYSSIKKGSQGVELWSDLSVLMGSTHETLIKYDDLKTYTIETDQDPMNSANIIGIYSRESFDGTWDGGSTWNREHVWCQSLSGGLYSSTGGNTRGAGSDIHHLRPALNVYNSTRGNTPYGTFEDKTIPGISQLGKTGNYYDAKKFEPRDDIKGDIARILFYVYTRYSSSLSDGSSDLVTGYRDEGKLQIQNIIVTDDGSETAAWNMLLEWNELDPVDYLEMYRNNKAQEIQGNRNVFIDHPEFARMCIDSNYSGAGALLDLNNTYDAERVSYLGIETTTLTLNKGNGRKIEAKTFPLNQKSHLKWTSADDSVAVVNQQGKIVALKEGTTTIKVEDTISKLSRNLSLNVHGDNAIFVYDGTQLGSGNTYETKSAVKTYNNLSVQITATIGSSQSGNLWLGTNAANASKANLSNYPQLASAMTSISTSSSTAALIFDAVFENINHISFSQIENSKASSIYVLYSVDGSTYQAVDKLTTISAGLGSVDISFDTIPSAKYAILIRDSSSSFPQSRKPSVSFLQSMPEVDYLNDIISHLDDFKGIDDKEARTQLVYVAKNLYNSLSQGDKGKINNAEKLNEVIDYSSEVISLINDAKAEFSVVREDIRNLSNIKSKLDEVKTIYNALSSSEKNKISNANLIDAMESAYEFMTYWYETVRISDDENILDDFASSTNLQQVLNLYNALSEDTKSLLEITYDTTDSEGTKTIKDSMDYLEEIAKNNPPDDNPDIPDDPDNPDNPDNPNDPDNKPHISVGAIIGIVVGIIIVSAIIVIVVMMLKKKNK